jgi:hypothetical protein
MQAIKGSYPIKENNRARSSSRQHYKSRPLSNIPWPIPHEGFEIEAARWYRGPTQNRCGFYWVYTVRVIPSFEEHEVLVCAYRAHESIFTKRRSSISRICGGAQAIVCTDETKLPDSLVARFEKTVALVRDKATHDESLSVRARDRQEEF